MKTKQLKFLFLFCVFTVVLICNLAVSAETTVSNPLITKLDTDFYISTDHGRNTYTQNGITTAYEGKITFSGIDSKHSIFVESGEHEIVLDNVRIHSSSASPVDITSEATVSLRIDNTNLLSADNVLFSAIHVENGSCLTISGDGKLVASGGEKAACIGGNYNEYISKAYCGNITIAGGEIVAKTGTHAIGHGNFKNLDVLMPNNKISFKMTGGVLLTQPSIAHNKDRVERLDNISITGGNTDAFRLCNELSLFDAGDCEILGFEGISYETTGMKTINGLIYLPYSAGIPSKIVTGEGTFVRLDSSFAFIPEDEKIMIISGEDKSTKFKYDYIDPDIKTTNYSLDGGNTWNVFPKGTLIAFCNYNGDISFDYSPYQKYDVILYNTNLAGDSAFAINDTTVNLTIFGSNTSKADGNNNAGIQVPPKSTLNISAESTGGIEVHGDGDGAGIGGGEGQDYGTINIYGGSVRAISGEGGGGAGLGSGYEAQGEGGSITIGGKSHVYAKSDGAYTWGGAGIGGGNDSGAGTILICDYASITAYGGPEGAGIGSAGNEGPENCNITIEDYAYIYAEGNEGAGIGGGYDKNGGNITITSGTVEVKSSNGGAGIGGGHGADSGNIIVNGGNIKATISGGGSKIGCGDGGSNTCSIPTLREVNFVTSENGVFYGNCFVYEPVDGFNWTGIKFCDSDYNNLYLYLPEETQVPEMCSVDGYVFKWDGSKYVEESNVSLGETEAVIDGKNTSFNFNHDGYTLGCQTDSFSFDCHDIITFKNIETDNYIVFTGKGNIQLTLDNINLEPTKPESALRASDETNLFLTLIGENRLTSTYSAVGVNENSYLTINGDGSLHALTNSSGAAIGGKVSSAAGNIIINSGVIHAESIGLADAGIGGAYGNSSLGKIVINGGYVTAIGGHASAGIGGGFLGTCNNEIIINGGTISAFGGKRNDTQFGAGIGEGYITTDPTVTVIINGGNIYAENGEITEEAIKAKTITDKNGNPVVKHTFTFDGLADKTPIDTALTNATYLTADMVTINDSLYLYLPENAVSKDVITLSETEYYNISDDSETKNHTHLYATSAKTKIHSIQDGFATVLISEKDVVAEGTALLVFASYNNKSLGEVRILDCPIDKAGKVVVELPDDLTPGANDVVFLWKSFGTPKPLCDKYSLNDQH